jgi:hypothetical protein
MKTIIVAILAALLLMPTADLWGGTTSANLSIVVTSSGGCGGAANVLGLGLVGPSSTFFSNTSNPSATTEFLNGQSIGSPPAGQGSAELPEQGSVDPAFLTTTLSQVRADHPTLLAPLVSGVTDVRVYRVFVAQAISGIHLVR